MCTKVKCFQECPVNAPVLKLKYQDHKTKQQNKQHYKTNKHCYLVPLLYINDLLSCAWVDCRENATRRCIHKLIVDKQLQNNKSIKQITIDLQSCAYWFLALWTICVVRIMKLFKKLQQDSFFFFILNIDASKMIWRFLSTTVNTDIHKHVWLRSITACSRLNTHTQN